MLTKQTNCSAIFPCNWNYIYIKLTSKCIFPLLKFLTSCLHFTAQGLKMTGMFFRLDIQYLPMLSQILAWFKPQATLSEKIWKPFKIPPRHTLLHGKTPLPQNPKHAVPQLWKCLPGTPSEHMTPVFVFLPSAYFLQRTFAPTHWRPLSENKFSIALSHNFRLIWKEMKRNTCY